jgi:betaine reductase
VIVTALPTVAATMGANRILHGVAINHPLGWPHNPPEKEKEARRRLVKRALEMLEAPVTACTIWEQA